jgi:hypothetical protein
MFGKKSMLWKRWITVRFRKCPEIQRMRDFAFLMTQIIRHARDGISELSVGVVNPIWLQPCFAKWQKNFFCASVLGFMADVLSCCIQSPTRDFFDHDPNTHFCANRPTIAKYDRAFNGSPSFHAFCRRHLKLVPCAQCRCRGCWSVTRLE